MIQPYYCVKEEIAHDPYLRARGLGFRLRLFGSSLDLSVHFHWQPFNVESLQQFRAIQPYGEAPDVYSCHRKWPANQESK